MDNFNKATDYLNELGCCNQCIFLYLDDKEYLQRENEIRPSNVTANPTDCISSNNYQFTCLPTETVNAKRAKGNICITCLGLFQDGLSDSTLEKMKNAILLEGYDAKVFAINLSLPVAVSVRIYSVWSLLLSKFPGLPSKHRNDHLALMKDSWRCIMGPRLSADTTLKFITGQNIDFCLNIIPSYCNDTEDCNILEILCKDKFNERRKQHKKFNEGVFTRQSVVDTFNSINLEQFLNCCPNFPKEPIHVLEFDKITCHHSSLYFAGRYNKYSRELPQTPWLVEGERRLKSSVQELICDTLNNFIRADSIKFSSSGREDVDVRTLGNGRPFVVEFVNPKSVHITEDCVKDLQCKVNKTTDFIAIHDLQTISRTETSNLKDGEVEKTKSYAALCLIKDSYDVKLLSLLEGLKEIEIHQTTPLRVLHRRPLSVRTRVIHTIKAEYIDQYYFKLYLTTQAGTYIKEFVHGDFGRTTPNLRILLGIEVDIVALDVENVHLDWPPSLS